MMTMSFHEGNKYEGSERSFLPRKLKLKYHFQYRHTQVFFLYTHTWIGYGRERRYVMILYELFLRDLVRGMNEIIIDILRSVGLEFMFERFLSKGEGGSEGEKCIRYYIIYINFLQSIYSL